MKLKFYEYTRYGKFVINNKIKKVVKRYLYYMYFKRILKIILRKSILSSFLDSVFDIFYSIIKYPSTKVLKAITIKVQEVQSSI